MGIPPAVVLCGFSRGAVAVSYVSLHDDEIAKLWAGFSRMIISMACGDGRGRSGSPLARYREGGRGCGWGGSEAGRCGRGRMSRRRISGFLKRKSWRGENFPCGGDSDQKRSFRVFG